MTRSPVVRLLPLIALLGAALTSRAAAQERLTIDRLHAVLVDAAETTAKIDSIAARVLDVSARGLALAKDFAKHNEEPCEYPQGHPELCANYDRERSDLNLRLAALEKEWKGYDDALKPLRRRFASLMDELRAATYVDAAASWQKAIVACTNVNGVREAASCLTTAVARHR